MAQLSPVPAYDDDNLEQDPEPANSWTGLLNDAVSQFASSIAEASRSLSAASAGFASEAGKMLEDAAGRAEQAAAEGRDMAREAARAAEEALSGRSAVQELISVAHDEISRAAAEAVGRIALEAGRWSDDVKMALDSSVAAGHDAAAAAREAAADARRADDETVRGPESSHAPEAGIAREVLDRLEADYKLLSELVSHLHERISGLSAAEPVPVPAAPTWEAGPDATTAEPQAPSEEMAWQPPAVAPEAPAPAYPVEHASDLRNEPAPAPPIEESESNAWASSEAPAGEVNEAYWGSSVLPAHEPHPTIDNPAGMNAEMPADPWRQDEGVTAHGYEEHESAHHSEEPHMSATEPSAEGVPPEPGSDMASGSQTSNYGHGVATATSAPVPSAAGMLLDGKIVLNVEPVPDFDRLLSLDAALSRLGSVRNVTLADYARDEVTFNLEMRAAVDVESFTRELSQTTGQAFEVKAASTDNLQLRFSGT